MVVVLSDYLGQVIDQYTDTSWDLSWLNSASEIVKTFIQVTRGIVHFSTNLYPERFPVSEFSKLCALSKDNFETSRAHLQMLNSRRT